MLQLLGGSNRLKSTSGNAIVIGETQIEIRKSRETPRSLRRSQFLAGLSLLHRWFYLDLVDLRYQRQHFDLYRRTHWPSYRRPILRHPGPTDFHHSPAGFSLARAPVYPGSNVAGERDRIHADCGHKSTARSPSIDRHRAAHGGSQHGAKLLACAARGTGAKSGPLTRA